MQANIDYAIEDSREIPAVLSPYTGKILKVSDHLKISAYWFATNFLWGAKLEIMLSDRRPGKVPSEKASMVKAPVTGLPIEST